MTHRSRARVSPGIKSALVSVVLDKGADPLPLKLVIYSNSATLIHGRGGLATSVHRPEPPPVYLDDAKSQPTGVQGLGFFKGGQVRAAELGKTPPLQLSNDCVNYHSPLAWPGIIPSAFHPPAPGSCPHCSIHLHPGLHPVCPPIPGTEKSKDETSYLPLGGSQSYMQE